MHSYGKECHFVFLTESRVCDYVVSVSITAVSLPFDIHIAGIVYI